MNFSSLVSLDLNLHEAAKTGNLERVRLLIEQGADKEEGDSDGFTPLQRACYHDHSLDVLQYLVEQGASLDKADNDGVTPLHTAAARGHFEITRYLLEQGADRDKATNEGWTPLHYAAEWGFLEILMLLMSYGADLNAKTNEGDLPIDIIRNEEIRQAIRDEPRRRMDEAPGKRATEQDRHPIAATSAFAQQEDEEGAEKQSNKRPRLEGAEAVTKVETKVAEEDEDSEPSSDEDDDDCGAKVKQCTS